MKQIEVKNVVESILSGAHNHNFTTNDNSREFELHPSSFPYCGLRDAYRRMTGDKHTREETLSSHYFTRVGTIVHSIFQNWFGLTDNEVVLIGDWKCNSCREMQYFQPKPKKCKCGKSEFTYWELGGVDLGTVFWHCDGLLRLKIKKKFYYILIDFKTSSVGRIDKYTKEGEGLPYSSNIAQLRGYCILMKRKYGIDISGAALVYLARDQPIKKYAVVPINLTKQEKDRASKQLSKDIRHFNVASRIEQLTQLKPLIKEKPCRSRAEYMKNMHSFYSPCPLHKVCFNRESLVKTIKVSWQKRERNLVK